MDLREIIVLIVTAIVFYLCACKWNRFFIVIIAVFALALVCHLVANTLCLDAGWIGAEWRGFEPRCTAEFSNHAGQYYSRPLWHILNGEQMIVPQSSFDDPRIVTEYNF